MAIIVKKFSVRVGGETFLPGSVINGLSENEEKSLVDDGYCEYPFVITSQTDPIVEQPLHTSIEQFKELKAAEQKDTLEKLGIEAGANEKDRIQQYTDFSEGNNTLNDSEEAGGEGPQTSLIVDN
jgi:hypothetical protein